MKFLPLFDLQLRHDYYADHRCSDFLVEVAPSTQRTLRNLRAILKENPSGLRVILPVDAEDKPLIPLPTGAVFTFHLRLQNPDFALFTDLPKRAGIERLLTYTYTNSDVNDPEQLILTEFPEPPERPSAHGVFAEINIVAPDTFLPANRPTSFHVDWTAKALHWTYYIVTDLNVAETPLQIKERIDNKRASETDTPVVFSLENQTTLVIEEFPQFDDATAQALAQRYPNLHRFRFVSDAAIPCRHKPRKRIELLFDQQLEPKVVDSASAQDPTPEPEQKHEQIVASLPNPSLRRYSRVPVAGHLEKQDTLFHVITQFTHPSFPTGG